MIGPAEGDQIDRFRVVAPIATGSSGTVFRAWDPRLEREVAIKLLDHAAASPELATRRTIDLRDRSADRSDDGLAEARIMARFAHANIVPIFELGLAGGRPFLVIELVEGEDLRHHLAAPRRPEHVLGLFAQAGRGLAAAHEHGVIHRDFKPDNVLVGTDGRARVTDFGIASLSPSAGAARPQPTARCVAGTPAYMAPELLRGEPPGVRSDIYAFCMALLEALTGAPGSAADAARLPVAGQVRAVIARGLADEPAQRPRDMAEVLRAIERRHRHRVWAAAALLAVTAAVGFAVLRGPALASCDDAPDVLVGRWDAARKASLVQALQPEPARVVGALDDYARELTERRLATCRAEQRSELTQGQAVIRASCLERRAFALGARVDAMIARPRTPSTAYQDAKSLSNLATCDALTAPPIRDRPRAAALQARFEAAWDPASSGRLPAYEVLERDATELGELELAALVAINLASVQLGLDQRKAGDATLRRAYEAATAIRADGLAAIALVERANNAASTGDVAAALSLSQLALPLVDRPGVSPRTQVRIRGAVGRALHQHGDPEPAVEHLRSALALIAAHQLELGPFELQTRVDLVSALCVLGGHSAEAVELARSTVARERQQSGERSANFGIALNTLALSLQQAGDVLAALPYRRQALEAVIAGSPAGHSRVAIQHSNLALDLLEAGQFEEARRESATALAQSAGNEGLVGRRAEMLAVHGAATFGTGRHREGIELVERAVLESTSQNGKDHPDTLEFIRSLVRLELELGRVDAAAQHVAALEEGYRAHPLPHDVRLPTLRGTAAAAVVLARGRPGEAEALARAAAAALIDDDARGEVLVALGRSLVAQRSWADARGVLAEALAIAARRSWRPGRVAAAEVVLAEAEHGAGDRAAGRDRARRARDVLSRVADQPAALAEVRRFLSADAGGAAPARQRSR